ncbi:4187_t:CDS:2, partial [Paraglomus occultum]
MNFEVSWKETVMSVVTTTTTTILYAPIVNDGIGPLVNFHLSSAFRLFSHADDDLDETSGETASGTAIASGSGTNTTEQEEGEIKAGEETAQSLKCDDCQRLFRDAAMAERHAIKSGHVNFSESTTAIKPLTEEEKREKIAELKERLAEKRRLKLVEEKEDEKLKEKIRRKSGKELNEAREKLQEREMEKALLLKKKEKEEERAAKARVKAQIEQDKRDRAAK